MFALIQSVPVRRLLLQQLPALVISLLIADTFYKFHSFLLETGAFLITWFIVDAILSGVAVVISHVRQAQTRKHPVSTE